MIHLTFVSGNVRGFREEYDTDHAGEALAEAVSKWYASGDQHPPRRAVFCVVVERDDCELSQPEILEALREIVTMEQVRGHRTEQART